MKADVVVIGGGAAGSMCALTAAQRGLHVVLLEPNKMLGKKLRITGKGRCNVTNNCDIKTVLANIPGDGRFLYSALNRFEPRDTMALFESLGVPLKTERGRRVFPQSDRAADVLAACSADDVRPLTDMVTVEAPETHEYDIELTYYTTKANESEVVQNVEGSGGAIDQYINWQGSTLNQDINPDELRKRILCPDWADDLIGATRVQIIKPEYTELNSTTVAKFSGKKTVKHIVRG